MKLLLSAAVLALMASGCADMDDRGPHAFPQDAARLAAAKSLAGTRLSKAAWPQADWWKRFRDPQLDELVDEALTDNPSLRVAEARARKALAVARAARAVLSPGVAGTADSTRQRFPEHGLVPPPFAGSWDVQNNLSVNLSYDLDFWDRNRAAYERALDRAHASQVDAVAARLLLSVSVARAYVQLQRAYALLDIAEATLGEREHVLALTRERVAAGLDSQLELKQAESAIPAARERIATLKERIALTCNQIAALLGQGPDRGLTITRPAAQAPGEIALPSNLPADLIGRRPDVVAQRWRVEAASRDIEVAKADFYPNINLTAFLGLQSIGFSSWLRAGSAIAGVGPALSLPIFDGGRLRAKLEERNADYDIAVERYNQTLVDALREVVDQLASFRWLEERQVQMQAALNAAQAAYDLALYRYREGIGNYLQVLSAESQVLAQKGLRADLRARGLELSINLVRALGGGYGGNVGGGTVGAVTPRSPS